MKPVIFCIVLFKMCLFSSLSFARVDAEKLYFVNAKARTVEERNKISEQGIAIDAVLSDSVSFLATHAEISRLKATGIPLDFTEAPERDVREFPESDSAFHNYAELTSELQKMKDTYPQLVTLFNIGTTTENRTIPGIRISSNPEADTLPAAVFFGCHHAREHLSVEVPLGIAQHLLENYSTDSRIKSIVDNREIWIVPMLNPDGAEFDIETGKYKYWRKNRRDNGGGSFGVDLNRNYPKGFGESGASSSASSDTYHGPTSFSEPETAALRDFLKARKNVGAMISFHTFSELVLWPWGYTNTPVSNDKDRSVFETMGKKMATFNKYKPMAASGLYIASGILDDWAYDELGIFAFTFELSPNSWFGGGFYPGASAIAPTLKANIEPVLYLIETAENPYGVLRGTPDPLDL